MPGVWNNGKATVAELSTHEISRKTREELIRIIRSAQVPIGANVSLESCDMRALQSLTYAARRCCRNQGY